MFSINFSDASEAERHILVDCDRDHFVCPFVRPSRLTLLAQQAFRVTLVFYLLFQSIIEVLRKETNISKSRNIRLLTINKYIKFQHNEYHNICYRQIDSLHCDIPESWSEATTPS